MSKSPRNASLAEGPAIRMRDEGPQAARLRSTSEPEAVPIGADIDEKGGAPLNFRVSAAFRREFRVYAAAHDLKLNELLRLAFEHYQTRARTKGLSRSLVDAALILAERDDGTDLSDVLQGLLEQWVAEQVGQPGLPQT